MKKHSILIIDNDLKYSLNISLRLENEFTVVTALSGKDGLLAFDAKPVSLILLDLNLPDMSGLEVLKRIRERCVDVKVLIITSKSCHEWAAQCADLNVQGYREKPIDPEKLVEKIRKIIGINDSKFLQILWGKEYEVRTVSISHTIRQAMNYIHKNYHKNFSRDDVAAFASISPDHLSRLFHKESGRRLKDYIAKYQTHKIKELLLKRPDMKIKNIATSVGIPDANYFCRFFKKHTGLTPTEFRKNSLT